MLSRHRGVSAEREGNRKMLDNHNNVHQYEFVSSNDIDYVSGKEIPWTWDRFTEVWMEEKPSGSFPKSIDIACSILAPFFQKRGNNLNGGRVLSEDKEDLYQELWILIHDKVGDYDPKQGNFNTYLSKHVTGVIREIISDGIPTNVIKKGYRVYNIEAMGTEDKNGETQEFEIVDHQSAVEYQVEKADRERQDIFFEKLVETDPEIQTNPAARFLNEAIFAKFLGGFGNLEVAIRNELEKDLELEAI